MLSFHPPFHPIKPSSNTLRVSRLRNTMLTVISIHLNSHDINIETDYRNTIFRKLEEEDWRIEWTWISRHRDFWILIMEELPSVIPKSIVEVLNRLENDEDNLFSWKLTRSQDKFSLTVSCKLPTKTPKKAKDDKKVTGRTTVKPVKRRRRKKN